MHRLNRRVFYGLDSNSPLLLLYTRLIALELYAKGRLPAWASGHDVCILLQDGSYSATIATLATNLSSALAPLACTDRNGSASVVGAVYPNLRYLRHVTEFAGGSSDHDLQAALDVLDDIVDELQQSGDPIC